MFLIPVHCDLRVVFIYLYVCNRHMSPTLLFWFVPKEIVR